MRGRPLGAYDGLWVEACAGNASGGSGGFEEDAAGADDDAIGAGEEDGVAWDLGGGAGDVHVFVLEVDFEDGVGADAELGEAGGAVGAGVFFAELDGGDGAGGDVVEGDGAAAPAERVVAVGEGGADEGLGLFAAPAGGVGGGEYAGDAPGALQAAGQGFGAERGGEEDGGRQGGEAASEVWLGVLGEHWSIPWMSEARWALRCVVMPIGMRFGTRCVGHVTPDGVRSGRHVGLGYVVGFVRENTTMDPRELREATRAEHEATEALMPLGGADLSREGYAEVLETLEPLVRGWEAWAERNAPDDLREMVVRRRRSHLLRADLQMMGGRTGRDCGAAVDWDAVVRDGIGGETEAAFEAGFLGAMYVMEGSTLGGRFLARHVEGVLGLEPGRGDAYFQGHGESTGALWREVTARIAGVPEELSSTLVEAARRTFRAFGEALRAGLGAPEPVQN